MTRNRVSAVVAGAALVVGSAVSLAAPVNAADANPNDPTFVPNATDVVGAGSDTTQIVTKDIANAYNVDRTQGRLASFAADGAPATVVLRAGSAAITRPNGSGAGKKLLYGASNDANVNFARSSSTLSTAEIDAGLKQAAFAVDGLQMAVRKAGSNAPASLTVADLLKIYKGEVTNWSEVGGQPGVIKALIPQSGSGTRSFFESQLKAANGGNTVVLKASDTQEHSDADLKNDANAIAPFSSARVTITPTVSLLGGWSAERAVYNVVRAADQDKYESIFGESGYICSAAGRTVLEAAGFKQLASPANGGACGEWVTGTVSNFKTAGDAGQAGAVATTTTLTATSTKAGAVDLRATVGATAGSAAGRVEFFLGDEKVGTAFPSGGVAELKLSGLPTGKRSYRANFVPTDANLFTPSASADIEVTVKAAASVTVTGATAAYGKAKSVTVKAVREGEPATGAVSVKVGSAAAKNYTLSSVGTVKVAIASTTKAGSLTVAASLPATDTAEAATASTKLSIAKAKSSTTAKAAKSKIKSSQRGSVSVKVSAPGTVTGKVTIKSGSKTVGTATVKNGKATVKLAKLKKGNYKLVVTYSGDSNISGSKAKTLKLKVTK